MNPLKEPPLFITNTIMFILVEEYYVDKFSCDGAAMLTFEALSKTSKFVTK